MDRLVVGIPRGFLCEYYNLWRYYFNKLDVQIVYSKPTDKEIIELGMNYANDEMCMSLKTFLGHVAYLQDKCDYILIPRVDNYGRDAQMCTNFSAIYDIVHNLFDKPILNYNVDYIRKETELRGLIEVGVALGFKKEECKKAYEYAYFMASKDEKRKNNKEFYKLNSSKKKVLLVGHNYVCNDNLIGKPIINYLKQLDCEVILASNFSSMVTQENCYNICYDLYWKHSKQLVGTIELYKEKIDGIILLSTFPCGPDSLVNELIIRRVDKPILQLIMDDTNSFTGIETRLESFLDILQSS